ncbi:TOBE domain-containing protein [Streptomyces sp. NPDC000345]|uniref:TOBE domain-containing protein n=1 Tax=Streptomyces sp. NPDC000345 TaxID=3364537 RepID=UPI0036B4D059
MLSGEDLETPALELVVEAVEDTGAVTYLHTTAKVGAESAEVVVRAPERQRHGKGEQLRVTVRPDDCHLFSALTERRLPGADG